MLYLSDKKETKYQIVYRKDHTVSEETAVRELAKYLKMMTGAEFPVVTDNQKKSDYEIVVGFAKRPGIKDDGSLGEEGYTLRTEGKKIYILGSGVRGALYGVYTFLEKFCGCRFLSDNFEIIPPETVKLTVPDGFDVTEVPVFEYRNAYWGCLTNADTCAKLKNNGCMGHEMTEEFGGGIDYNGSFCHTMAELNEQDDFWNMPCLCDEEVYERVLKNVKKQLRAHPEKTIISVSQLDGNDGECKCEKCRKVYEEEGSHMGTLLRMVNRVQNDIADEFPNAVVDTLAYRYTRKPTDKTVPDPRVIVRLCNIECSFRTPLINDKPENDNGEPGFVENLKKWNEICGRLYIWDYTTNYANMTTLFPNFNCLLPNIRLFAENGVRGVFEQGNYEPHNGEFEELRAYLLAKILWNPYMSDVEYRAHMLDFCNGYYGDAAKYIVEYLDLVHTVANDRFMTIYFDNSSRFVYMPGYKTELEGAFAFYEKASAIFDEAECAAWKSGDRRIYDNVRRSRIQLYNYYFFILTAKQNELKEENEKKPNPANDTAVEMIELIKMESNRTAFNLMRELGVKMPREFASVDFTKVPDLHGYILWW